VAVVVVVVAVAVSTDGGVYIKKGVVVEEEAAVSLTSWKCWDAWGLDMGLSMSKTNDHLIICSSNKTIELLILAQSRAVRPDSVEVHSLTTCLSVFSSSTRWYIARTLNGLR